MPGVTSAEKLILPLFFNDKKDTSPLGMLLSSNSVLKHLMDPWKEEKVMEDFNEQINLLKNASGRIDQIFKPILHVVKHYDSNFKSVMQNLTRGFNIYREFEMNTFRA